MLSYPATPCSLALPRRRGLGGERLDVLKVPADKVVVRRHVDRGLEEVAAQVDLEEVDALGGERDVPAAQRHVRARLGGGVETRTCCGPSRYHSLLTEPS